MCAVQMCSVHVITDCAVISASTYVCEKLYGMLVRMYIGTVVYYRKVCVIYICTPSHVVQYRHCTVCVLAVCTMGLTVYTYLCVCYTTATG